VTAPPLNHRQRAAIEHGDGPLMILAGAGTGKTRVLVHRIARLVDSGVPPWEVLAVTFTNKAAGEMRHRLRDLLGERADAMWIGTFHAICARILRQHATAGRTKDFTVFDERDQRETIERILRDTGVASDAQARAGAVLARIDSAKNEGVIPAAWSRAPIGESDADESATDDSPGMTTVTESSDTDRDDPDDERPPDVVIAATPTAAPGVDDKLLARVYPRYQARLAREDAVDFNDLLLLVLGLLDDPATGPALRTRFRHVLVDEFQDTNGVQYDLVWRLAEATRNFTVVGDDDQSIYAWRGARPGNLLHLDRVLTDTRIVKLEQNYRSTQTILDVANRLIAKNHDRHDKALWTDQGDGPPVEVVRSDDERLEARWVARWVYDALGSGMRGLGGSADRPEGYAPSDVAVLFRTNAQARVLEEHLRAARVPSRVVGATSFYDRREVRDVVGYLRLLVNPRADAALERVINVPPRGIGEKTLGQIRAHAKVGGSTLYEATKLAGGGGIATLGTAIRKKVQAFVDLVEGIRAGMAVRPSISWIVVQVIERSGMAAKLQGDHSEEAAERLNNLAELVNAAVDVERSGELASPLPGVPGAALAMTPMAGAGTGTATPTGSTMASTGGIIATEAKLAEASPTAPIPAVVAIVDPVAIITRFLERVSLSSPADDAEGGNAATAAAREAVPRVSLMTIHAAKGLEWPVVIVTGMEDGLFPSLRPREDVGPREALEEERRLAYVAITRARERLILSYARTRRVWGETQLQEPSRFLEDLPPHALARPWEDVRDER
jgi:DNA helicase-2/ATP-dependent DNA helicase PcrA